MKNKISLSIIAMLFCILSAKSQDIDCDDLMSYIKNKGGYPTTVTPYNSSMLISASLYSYKGDYYVIAKFKTSDYDYTGRSYIFCGVPYYNWINFSTSSSSYGKAFHAYIMDYKCDCN